MESDFEDKIRGAFVGVLLGDALGAPHEFKYNKYGYSGKLEYPIESYNRFTKITTNYGIGRYSDDSEFTLALLRSIIILNSYDKDSVIKVYIEVCKSCPFLGTNTRQLFKGIKTLRGYQSRWDKKFKDEKSRLDTQSNGSLMRSFPLIVVKKDDIIMDCNLTNPNSVNIESNLIQMEVIRNNILSNNNELEFSKYPSIDKEIFELKKRDLTKQKGWVLHALYCSLYSQKHFGSLSDCLLWINKQKGDTDTNGAIAGAVIGSKIGFKKIMEEKYMKENWNMLLNVNNLKDFDELCKKLTQMFNKTID